MTIIDTLVSNLYYDEKGSEWHGITYSKSKGNTLELFDTPRQWGVPVRTIYGFRNHKEKGDYGSWLCKAITETLAAAEELVDITTLGPLPDGAFRDAFFAGLAALARKEVVVRVLVSSYDQDAEEWAKALLHHLHQAVGLDLDQLKLSFYVGYYGAKVRPSWIHSKIIAVDGKRALVGGHNWWARDYLEYPPVHDVTLRVTGPAAHDAHAFANHIWQYAKKNSLYSGCWSWTPGTGAKLRTGKFHVGTPAEPSAQDAEGGTMLALGRLGTIAPEGAAQASDRAKLNAVDEATTILRLSQQDLLLPSPITPHPFIEKLAWKLLTRKDLEVQAVLSSPHGGSGRSAYVSGSLAEGFDVGYGAAGTYAYVKKRVQAMAGDALPYRKELGSKAALVKDAMTRCRITTLRTASEDDQAEDAYAWPGNYKIRCFPFGKKDMLAAPANHAKVYIIDDRAFYFGSDNLYPNRNQEFGYLVEDEELTRWFIAAYWDKIWEASKHAAVTEE